MTGARPNRVLLTLLAIWVAGTLLTGFVVHAPNRLRSGDAIAFWAAVDPAIVAAVAAIGIALFAACFVGRGRTTDRVVLVLAAILLLSILMAAGRAAIRLAVTSSPVARTALGAAFWIGSLCAGLMIVDAWQKLGAAPRSKILFAVALATAIIAMARWGMWDSLSIAKEYRQHRAAFADEFVRHCQLAGIATAMALLAGIPLGIAMSRRPRGQASVYAILNAIQTIPSLALFGLLIGPLAALGLGAIGAVPALIALFLYLLLPIVRSTHAGIAGVDGAVIESAQGMGFAPRQILWRIELPLAAPLLLAGIRIVAVQAVGLTVVAALIGAGGLGTFVFQGLGQYAADLILLGALPAIFLALGVDLAFRGLAAAIIRRRPST